MKIIIENPEDLKKFGIYAIKNTLNNKMYIGSTKNSFSRRFVEHKSKLKANRHHNIHLQRAFNTYESDNFNFIIIEILENNNDLREKEKYYINFYKSVKKGYNHSDNTYAPPTSDAIKQKISNTLKNKHLNDKKFRENFLKLQERKKGKPSWNLGKKCDNISNARKKIFDDIEVYDINMSFFRKFDNPIEIEKFSKLETNDLPIPDKIPYIARNNHTINNTKISYQKITNKIINSQNIHRAIRNNSFYKGLFFKKVAVNKIL